LSIGRQVGDWSKTIVKIILILSELDIRAGHTVSVDCQAHTFGPFRIARSGKLSSTS